MNLRDDRESIQALMSLYANGLELKNIAAYGPPELRALLMPHVAEIDRMMERIRASKQPVDIPQPTMRTPC